MDGKNTDKIKINVYGGNAGFLLGWFGVGYGLGMGRLCSSYGGLGCFKGYF